MSSPDDSRSDLDFGPTLRGFVVNQRVFDRYVLREILGRGGMGIVWRAYDEQLECEVALKFLPEMVAFDEQAIADLKRETRKTRELRHHHIVQVYDFVTDKRSVCISMEWVDGLTLSAIKAGRKEGFLEVEEITRWVRQLCEALNYAHDRAKLAHRDLKPANLMINGKGELKITDFGIARSISDSLSMLTRGGGPSGTLVYMSPQQLDAECASHLDDIYSLGATLYELLTSKPPFYSGGIERQIHEKVPPSVARRREELNGPHGRTVPPQWEATIAACLAKDPAHRPQSAQEVACRLGLSGHFTASTTHKSLKPKIIREPFKAAPGKTRSVVGAALIILLATGVISGWFGYEQRRREAKDREQLAQQKARDERDAETARQREVAEQQRLEAEKRIAAETQAETERLAAARAKDEEAKKKADSLKAIAAASKERPYENSYGMKFVPVPGTGVLFSIWETRAKDYKAFTDATQGEQVVPGFKEKQEHPAAARTWDQATAFCKWLTESERKAGMIAASHRYRLPTDLEWSAAVGLGKENGATPAARSAKVKDVYPWGTQWPPPNGAGNYAPELKVDDYEETSPVGSFSANRYGIFDLGGNVTEWCQDWDDATKFGRVLRGSWLMADRSRYLLSSYRGGAPPNMTYYWIGFRCVLAVEPSR